MIDPADRPRTLAALAVLQGVGSERVDQFMRVAWLARFSVGQSVMGVGDAVGAVPLVVSGSIRVSKIGESGRVITIYHFGTGECCVLAANSVMGDQGFPATARVEEAAEVALLPAAVFNEWLATSARWRAFVLGAMSYRLVSLLDTLENVAFTRLDARVASLLVARAGGQAGAVRITHQTIADELGSSREVVSRVLGGLQDQGLVRLTRGEVHVLEPALRALSPLR